MAQQGHQRPVLPRLGVQGGHRRRGAGFRHADCRPAVCLHRRRLDHQRRQRPVRAYLPLRQRHGPRLAEHGRRAEQQLQHLLYPGGPGAGGADLLRLFRGVRLYPAHRRRPALRGPIHDLPRRRRPGPYRSQPGLQLLRPGPDLHPAADGHRHRRGRQRRLPGHSLRGGQHHRRRRQRGLHHRDHHPPPGHLGGSQRPDPHHDGAGGGRRRPGRDRRRRPQRLCGRLPHRRQVRYGREPGPRRAVGRRLLQADQLFRRAAHRRPGDRGLCDDRRPPLGKRLRQQHRGPRGGQHHQRDRPLPGHRARPGIRHQRHRPRAAHRRHQQRFLGQRPGGAEQGGPFPRAGGRHRHRHLHVPRHRHRAAGGLHRLPVHPVHHRRDDHRAQCGGQKRRLCRADAESLRHQRQPGGRRQRAGHLSKR